MSIRTLSRLALVAAAVASAVASAASLEFHHPKARAMPPASPNSAAYMLVHNHTDQEQVLVGVESDVAKAVELHTHDMVDGTMQMRQVHEIVIPADGSVAFKPGSYHVMMMGLNRTLVPGESVDFTLILKSGERIPMNAEIVMPEELGMPMKHDAMKHGDMKQGMKMSGEHKHH
ncbi:copper chaperone PCu(A)C [Maribrevibacterium harenarium]|uniref:Copper chaperone PCu(A)C n=1 Tax=Maribrevibacterium harenarium TaxID=2589817 RepID=A0A501WUH8_9GAMM|nr:copper chaperone PCu(A)C [Maribrevibacterium harenarium]TPE53393.1 copper chaperone PCu(A)C [Maribrevibacterium harenarium]